VPLSNSLPLEESRLTWDVQLKHPAGRDPSYLIAWMNSNLPFLT
jgi:hypothetical protein